MAGEAFKWFELIIHGQVPSLFILLAVVGLIGSDFVHFDTNEFVGGVVLLKGFQGLCFLT